MLGGILGLSAGVILAFLVAAILLHWVVPSYGLLIILAIMAVFATVFVMCLVISLIRASGTQDVPMARRVVPVVIGMLCGFAVVLAYPVFCATAHPLDPDSTDLIVIERNSPEASHRSADVVAVGDGQARMYMIGNSLISPYAWAYDSVPISTDSPLRRFVSLEDHGSMTYSVSFKDGEPKLYAQSGSEPDEHGMMSVPAVPLGIAEEAHARDGGASYFDITHAYADVYVVVPSGDGECLLVTARGDGTMDFVPLGVRFGYGLLSDGFIRSDLAKVPLADEGPVVKLPSAE